jgi:hypothetical protein
MSNRGEINNVRLDPAVIERPSEVDLAWTAGFMDGEGCFTLLGRRSNVRKWDRRPSVSAAQVRLAPLVKLQGLYGGALRRTGRDSYAYQWVLSTREQLTVVPWILPYLVLKNEEAQIVLSYARLVNRSRRVSEENMAARIVLVDRLEEIRDEQ